jgi:F0F1-type ATP synthase delta subunit
MTRRLTLLVALLLFLHSVTGASRGTAAVDVIEFSLKQN